MKKQLKQAWHFLWHEDTWYAWIAQVLVAFVIIKWVLYPGVGLIFGTQLPVVAVVSSSMDHKGEFLCSDESGEDWWDVCGQWYEERGITQQQFESFSLSNGFRKGDVIALRGISPEKLEIGDVIVYQAANKPYPIIHRIVNRTESGFVTKGDNNPYPIEQYVVSNGIGASECYRVQGQSFILSPCTQDSIRVDAQTPGAIRLLDETQVSQDAIIGKAYGRIPWAGYVKIGFVWFLDTIGLDGLAAHL